ncbi:MAG: sigma-70 family RNA polymerase sigma factor [Chloroflexota bacterium]|nr:sigma-70 family RNA polymerase sigma factor [Chloroflexota bacterium]
MLDIGALIQRWQGGDERAATALYNHHRDSVFRLAYGLLGNTADAEEAAQDALTYALVNIHRYDPGRASFATWLHTITVSRCRDRHRRRRSLTFSLATWLQRGRDVPDSASGPESRAIQAETRSQVWEAVQALSRPLREAVLLRYWAGHTYREMGEILDCPVPTAQSRVRLAYKRLRATLAPADLAGLREEKA